MLEPTHLALLRRSPVLAGLDEEDFHVLAAALQARPLKKGWTLFQQGERGSSMAFVLQGRLAVFIEEEGGGSRCVQQLQAGDTVGEMCCIDPAPRSATVVAATDCLALELDQYVLQAFTNHAPEAVATVVGGVIRFVTTLLEETDLEIECERQRLESQARQETDDSREARRSALEGMPKQDPEPTELPPLPRFSGLRGADLERLAEMTAPMLYPAGSQLCREGEPGYTCFLILQGQVEVRGGPGGRGRLLATMGPGSILGQMALVSWAPRTATLLAVSRVVALVVGRELFDGLLDGASPLALRFQRQVAVSGIRQLRLANEILAQGIGSEEDGAAELGYAQAALREWGLPPGEEELGE